MPRKMGPSWMASKQELTWESQPLSNPVSRIVIKSAARFAAEPARGHVFLQQRTRAILGIAQTFVQDVQDVHANIQPNEIRQLQRAHRMVHSRLHHRIDS